MLCCCANPYCRSCRRYDPWWWQNHWAPVLPLPVRPRLPEPPPRIDIREGVDRAHDMLTNR